MVALNVSDNDTPPKHVLDWCRELVRVIKHDGIWGIPRSNTVFKIDQNNKQLVLVAGDETDGDFIATKMVFAHIGWDVVGKKS